jgi:UDP-glucose 6-dehydrogenase
MICFLGTSHAPTTLAAAARSHGLRVTNELALATLVFVSEDTPTDANGKRDLAQIEGYVNQALKGSTAPVVITSQVHPGFTRTCGIYKDATSRLFHLAETLRMKDAMERARYPEQFIVGVADPHEYNLPVEFMNYMYAHGDPRVLIMSYEEAEFSKIAINMMLAAQVDATNRLSKAAEKVGARWSAVADALRADCRIGPDAYLTPGRWQNSRHLLRDHVTLEQIIAR